MDSGVESAALDPARVGLITKARPPWPREFTVKLTHRVGSKVEPTLMKGAWGKKEWEN